MNLPSRELAWLLRDADHPSAAAAADNAESEVRVSEVNRDDLLRTHRVRQSVQEASSRAEAALEIGRLIESLGRQADDKILVCRVSDGQDHYVVFLTGSGDAVVGVLTPPRRLRRPAEPRSAASDHR